jgi:hypothetical protein
MLLDAEITFWYTKDDRYVLEFRCLRRLERSSASYDTIKYDICYYFYVLALFACQTKHRIVVKPYKCSSKLIYGEIQSQTHQ